MSFDIKDIARHVIKLSDGRYINAHFEPVAAQNQAQRWLTWSSAKMVADSHTFIGMGARAVRLMPAIYVAVMLDGKYVCLGRKHEAQELWKPELNPGARLVKYVPAKRGHK